MLKKTLLLFIPFLLVACSSNTNVEISTMPSLLYTLYLSEEKGIAYVFENCLLNDQEKYLGFSKNNGDYYYSTSLEYEYENENVKLYMANSYLGKKLMIFYEYKGQTTFFEIETFLEFAGISGTKKVYSVRYDFQWNYFIPNFRQYFVGTDYEYNLFSQALNEKIYTNMDKESLFSQLVNLNISSYDFRQFLKDEDVNKKDIYAS